MAQIEPALLQMEQRIWEQWRPAARLSLAAWADKHFRLPAGDANAGRWQCLPYQRGLLDAITDPLIERVSIMKSARVGYTLGCICAAVAYFIDHDPCPIMIVQPTIDDCKTFSKEHIAPTLEIPVLRGRVAEAKTRDPNNTLRQKLFAGGSLSLVGANSPSGFRRVSRRVVLFDEVDGYPPSAGTEGDQIELGIRRTEYYWNRKIVAGSTPTIESISRILKLFQAGDQRRYYVPCPHCGAYQVLKFPNLKWPTGQPQAAVFLCTENQCTIEHRSKRDMLEAGEWRAEKPEHFTEHRRHASFHIWAGYSYSPNATWGQLAEEFVVATHGGSTTLRTFVNTALGEPWVERGDAPEWEPLMRRREPYTIGTCPDGVLLLVAGVDVQKDRLVYEVVGYGRGKTSWSIDYATLPGDTADLDHGPWRELDALLARSFPHDHGVELSIRLLAIDSGYNTNQVYAWTRRYPLARVIAVKGQPSGSALVAAPQAVDYTGRGQKIRRGVKVWPVCSSVAKTEFYGFLRLELPVDGIGLPPPGFCHFPEYGEDYFRELTAEQLISRKTRAGFVRMDWEIIPGRRNEALDCRVYARAAAAVAGLDRFTEADWRALEAAVGDDPSPPVPTPPPVAPPPPELRAPAPAPDSWRFNTPPPARPAGNPWLGGRARWFDR